MSETKTKQQSAPDTAMMKPAEVKPEIKKTEVITAVVDEVRVQREVPVEAPTSVGKPQSALDEIKTQGGMQGFDTSAVSLPLLRLEHTTDFAGEPNPLRGHFTLSDRDDLGEWHKKDLGEVVNCSALIQRYFLSLREQDGTKYYSGEFDSPLEKVDLLTSSGEKDARPKLFASDTPTNLAKKFQIEDKEGRLRSKLNLLLTLYITVKQGDKDILVKWRTNTSAAMAWKKYVRLVTPFVVETEVTRVENKNGTNKFYVPVFKATKKIENLEEVLKKQKEVRNMLNISEDGSVAHPIDEVAF